MVNNKFLLEKRIKSVNTVLKGSFGLGFIGKKGLAYYIALGVINDVKINKSGEDMDFGVLR